MGMNSEGQNEREHEFHETPDVSSDKDEQKLLETILRDTMSKSNGEAL